MIRQMTLGEVLAEEGAERALAAKPDWSSLADKWLTSISSGDTFTSEALTEAIGYPSGTYIVMNTNNAVGAKIKVWAQGNLITKEGYVKSTNWRSHGRVITLWRKI